MLVVVVGHPRNGLADTATVRKLVEDLLVLLEGSVTQLGSTCSGRPRSHLLVALGDTELSLTPQLTGLHVDQATVDANGALQIAAFPGDVGQLQQRVVDKSTVGKLSLQSLGHRGGQLKPVHLEVDLPQLDVGFLQQSST